MDNKSDTAISRKEYKKSIAALEKRLDEYEKELAKTTKVAAAAYEVTKSEIEVEREWVPPAYESYPERMRFAWNGHDLGEPIEGITFTPDRDLEFGYDHVQVALKKGVECTVPPAIYNEVEWRTKED